VTPAFPGYVSGHSTFSRAGAEVLTAITGNEYFPRGMWSVIVDYLSVDVGPGAGLELQWATYYDAADDAGRSRLFGGIHIQADDFAGRKIGSACGRAAWQVAQTYFTSSSSSATACQPQP
jgi:hypothetical protein